MRRSNETVGKDVKDVRDVKDVKDAKDVIQTEDLLSGCQYPVLAELDNGGRRA